MPDQPTTAVLADVQNIYYTTRQIYQRTFDYRKCWEKISGSGVITSAFAYATHRNDSGQLRFQSALRNIGFTVKLKPFIQRSDGSAKGDWDVGITIDALLVAPEVERIVLLSGDGDFDLLLDAVRTRFQVKTEVYGVPELTASSLIEMADVYHEIGDNLLQPRSERK
ncbi:MAG: uncharacterized LabA/DUF88 family protein [Gammaproteobacteria bacterium]|jgi:uncharacterized LabA/DUF88 family protein